MHDIIIQNIMIYDLWSICQLVSQMSIAISLRLPDQTVHSLDQLASNLERPRSFLIRKAIEEYIEEYTDYLIALERLKDKNDRIISSSELRNDLGL